LTTRKFNPVKKDRLFYDKFQFCIGFHLDEVSCLRCLDHAQIDSLIQRRRQWREIARQRWSQSGQKASTILGRAYKEITDDMVADLHTLAEVLLTTSDEFKLVVSINQAYLYTNDLPLIERLDHLPILSYKTFSESVVSRPKNTIALKKPKYQFRSYFRQFNLTQQQKDNLEKFLTNQQQHVRISPALREWLAFPFNRIQDYFFVDHDSETWLTMLNLVVPGVIRKTLHIIPAK
jgi:hypothetical protein